MSKRPTQERRGHVSLLPWPGPEKGKTEGRCGLGGDSGWWLCQWG